MHHRVKNLVGLHVGFLTVTEYAGSDGHHTLWKCLCAACGKTVVLNSGRLGSYRKNGNLVSCGCRRGKSIGERNARHGMSRTPIWAVWHSMKERCETPTAQAWKNYGGRGITVCKEWSESFEKFYEDMAPTYQKGLQLDRIDNEKGYSKDNCRWISARENCNNRRRTVLVDGKPLADWSRETGIGMTTLYYRLAHGCPRERLFDKPDVTNRFTTSSTAAPATGSSSSERKAH